MARLKGHGRLQMQQKRQREEEQKIAEKHRQTMFTGGHSSDDQLHGYSEGEIL